MDTSPYRRMERGSRLFGPNRSRAMFILFRSPAASPRRSLRTRVVSLVWPGQPTGRSCSMDLIAAELFQLCGEYLRRAAHRHPLQASEITFTKYLRPAKGTA